MEIRIRRCAPHGKRQLVVLDDPRRLAVQVEAGPDDDRGLLAAKQLLPVDVEGSDEAVPL